MSPAPLRSRQAFTPTPAYEAGGEGRARSRWRRPLIVGLAGMAVVGAFAGGLYLALLRVPAAPPRTQDVGRVRATFETQPRVPATGQATLTLVLMDAGGSPVTGASVTFSYDMDRDGLGRPMIRMGPPGRAVASMVSPGRYAAPVAFSMSGQWTVRAAIAFDGQTEGEARFLVAVR